MAILEVARLGNPVLREVSAPVPIDELRSADTQRFIDDLVETMRHHDGAGLAAPQVSVLRRIVLIEVDENPRYPEFPDIPLTILVNPEITFLSDDVVRIWESCLSVNTLRGLVPRRRHVAVKALDRHGEPLEFEATDIFAGIVQHECDHIDGKLFIDRVEDLRTLSYLPEFARFRADEPHVVVD